MNLKIVPFRWGDQNMTRECRVIRDRVFLEEQGVPFALENRGNLEAQFYLAYDTSGEAEIPMGCARYRKTEEGYKIERVAVLPGYRDRAVGAAIVERILLDIPRSQAYLHAQEGARRFWERVGFAVEGDPFYEAEIRHFRMKAEL
ncbi:GNAT family N-acetyltransferase [Cryomorphaceae bacterium]|nr:GNAT family N-acetyltransferase [Cryomorphaceae bacterium]